MINLISTMISLISTMISLISTMISLTKLCIAKFHVLPMPRVPSPYLEEAFLQVGIGSKHGHTLNCHRVESRQVLRRDHMTSHERHDPQI